MPFSAHSGGVSLVDYIFDKDYDDDDDDEDDDDDN